MKTKAKTNSKETIKDYVNWFEIPVLNLERAVNFYNQLYDIDMEQIEANGYAMAFFPGDKGVGGALVKGPGCIPSETGSLIYLNADKNLQQILNRVERNGGRVILGKTEINSDAGHFALFIDSEGNKLALHSEKQPKTINPKDQSQVPKPKSNSQTTKTKNIKEKAEN